MEKTVILDIKLDTGQSLSDAAKLRDELLALKDAQAANKRETQEQKELYEAQSASIKSVQERINLLTQAVKNQETANKSNSGSFNQLQAAYKVGEASLKALTGTMKRNEDGSIALTKEYFDQKKAVDEAKNALLLFNAGISQGNLNVGNYDNTLTGMRQKLADLEVVIQNTDVGSEKFLEAQKNAEKLKGEIQQVSGQYDSMGNKVAKNPVRDSFNDMQSAAIATTAAIGFVSMAVGTETKAGEALRVVTVALTVAQTALTIARTKDDFIGAKQIITDKIATATKWLYTKSVNAATGALTGFGLALSGLAIGAAVFGLVKLNNIFKEAAKSVDAAKNSLLGYGEALAKTSLSNEKELAQIQNTIDLRKAEGAGLKEIRDLQVDLLNKQEEIRNKKAAQLLIDKAVNKEAIDAAKDEEELNELKAKGNDLEKQSVALINEKYEIIDGQHRFECVKELKLPLHYIVCKGYGLNEVHVLNQNSKTWNADDYLTGYCNLGNKNYLQYKKFKEKYQLGHNECMAMLTGVNTGGGNIFEDFKNGNFKITHLEEAEHRAEKIWLFKDIYDGFKRRAFVYAMLYLFDKPQFEFTEFLQKVKNQPSALTDCNDSKQYVSLIEEIYNYRRREKVNLRY